MISAEVAGIAITIAKGMIKLTRRLDLLMAEKESGTSPLDLTIPAVLKPITKPKAGTALRKFLQAAH